MSQIKVKAAEGLRVPSENNPFEYIEQTPLLVEDSLYYRRLIVDGDLIVVAEPKEKGAKA